MSKFVRTAGEIIAVAVAIAAAIPTGGASVGATATLLSSALGVSAAAASAIAAGVSVSITALEALTAKKPTTVGSPMDWKSDPNAGIPHVAGRMYTAGQITYRETYQKNNEAETIQTVYSTGPIKGYESLYVDGVATSVDGITANIIDRGHMYVSTQLGAQPEPKQLGDLGPPNYTAASKMSGLAASSITFTYDTSGGHTLTTEPQTGYVVLGTPVYDPRKDSTYPGGNGTQRSNDETTWSFTGYDNPGLKALSYLIGYRQKGNVVIGVGLPISAIRVDQLVEMANVCDANGWKMGGVIMSTDDRWTMYGQILQAGGAVPTRSGTRTGCIVNTPKVSLATFERDDIIGDWSIQGSTSRRARINAIIPSYMAEQSVVGETSDANSNTVLQTTVTWGMAAAGIIIVEDYVTFDGGQRQKAVSYPFVTGHTTTTDDLAPTQVAQLARYDIENSREFGPIAMTMKPRWMGYQAGDVITGGASTSEMGLVGQDIMLLQRSFSPANMTVSMTARSETKAKHAFALGQTTPPPPTPSLSGPPLIPVPGADAWNLTAGELTAANGTTGAALFLNGTSDSNSIDAVIVEMRVSTGDQAAADDWEGVTTLAPSFSGQLTITSVMDQTAYQVAVSYRKGVGTGTRLILGPATAGQTAVPWQAGVVGPGKPQDSATVGAPTGTYVAGVLAEELTQQIVALQAATAVDITPPAIPTGLTASSTIAADGTIDLAFSWAANTEADFSSYVLQVELNGGGYVSFAAPKNAYVFHGLQPNTPFMAQVAAFDTSNNSSGFCAAYVGTTTKDTTPPAAPTNLTVTPGINSVILNAAAPSDADTVAIRFYASADEIFAHASPVGIVNALPARTVGRTTQQNSGSTVYYFATALDSSGNEGASVGPAQGSTYSLSDADFTPGLYPTQSYSSLAAFPASTGSGRVAFSQADGKLYRDTSAGWTAQVSGVDIQSGTLYGNQIVAGTIQSAQIAAGAITVSKLGVLGDSLFADSQVQDIAWWTSNPTGLPGGQGYQVANADGLTWYWAQGGDNPTYGGGANAWRLGRASDGTGTSGAGCFLFTPMQGGITAGSYYNIRLTATNYSQPSQALQVTMRWLDANGGFIQDNSIGARATGVGPPFAAFDDQIQAPTGAAYYRLYWFNTGGDSGGFNFVIGGITVREAGTGQLIVDGTIAASKLVVGSITTDYLAAGSITGDRISSTTSLPASLTIGDTGYSLSVLQGGVASGSNGANLLPYSDFPASLTGWAIGYNPGNDGLTAYGINNDAGKNYIVWQWNAADAGHVVSVLSQRFNVTGNSILYIGAYFQASNANFNAVYRAYDNNNNIVQAATFGAYDGGQPGFPGAGQSWEQCRHGGFFALPANAATIQLEFYATPQGPGQATAYFAAPMVITASSGQSIPPSYVPGPNPDAAAIINANVTQISPGKILISGATTLASWIYGGDNTSINGGAIATNTITANKVSIGQRGVQTIGITFSYDKVNTVTWTAGYVEWYDENYNRQVTAIGAGSASRVSQGGGVSSVAYVWFDRSASVANGVLYGGEQTANAIMSNPNNVILANYFGGTSLNANYGQTIIDGSNIYTGSITADRMAVTQLSAITADIGTIRAGVLVSQRGLSELDLNNGRIIFNSGSMMKVVGEGFGTSGQFVEWAGPSMDPSQCSEANAVSYLRVDGAAYFGGSLSAGTLKNAVRTTSTSANADVTTGLFGSNGNARQVVVSLNFSATQSITGACPANPNPSAQVQLFRGTDSSGTLLTTFNIAGNFTCDPGFGPQEPGSWTEYITGSGTYTDNTGGASCSYYVRIASRTALISNQSTANTQTLGVVSTEQ